MLALDVQQAAAEEVAPFNRPQGFWQVTWMASLCPRWWKADILGIGPACRVQWSGPQPSPSSTVI